MCIHQHMQFIVTLKNCVSALIFDNSECINPNNFRPDVL